MKQNTCLGLMALCVASGCSRNESPPPPVPVPAAQRPAPVAVQPAPSPAPAPAAVAVATPGAAAPFERPLDAEALDAALRNYDAQHDRVPKTIEEMVSLKLIPRMPTPPPGKRYVIDQQKRRIQIVNR